MDTGMIGTVGILAVALLAMAVLFLLLYIKMRQAQGESVAQSGEMVLKMTEMLRSEIQSTTSQNRLEMQQRFDRLLETLNSSSQENLKAIQRQFTQSADIIKEVTERLTKLDDTNKQVLDFSSQLRSLENILKNPKQRGILGEYFLETLLSNVLNPNQYKMQYQFPGGEIVDAAIFYRDTIIPVDAKFSLEKYNMIMETTDEARRQQLEKEFRMDIKVRIDETSKYVRPKDGTTEFAFMFIPAEGVYYNLLIYNVGSIAISMKDMIEYAFRKHVIIVSPTSFYAYLETVLQGLKAQEVEKNVQVIISRIQELQKHLAVYEDHMKKVGKNLSATVSSYNAASQEFRKVDRDIYKITDGKSGGAVGTELVDKPRGD
ncbi:MAG: DNA recombination protein RmuC [Spirochaetes bacterium]|nr:DNA recombination protein RmuC [Spirochaetota bacterium]